MTITNINAKTIDDLQELGKLTGKEKTIISNGNDTRKVTIDTIVGYAAGVLARTPDSSSAAPSPGGNLNGQCIFFVPEGKEVPVSERTPGSFYIEEQNQVSIRSKVSIPTSVSVSHNLGLRRV